MLLTVLIGLYFLFNGMKPSTETVAQYANNFHRVWVAEIERGETKLIKVGRQPILVWRRNDEEIAQAMALLDPKTSSETWLSILNDGTLALELGSEKFASLEWFIVSPINTGGIGCVVLTKAGDYGGFFDPCQGAHFDLWGRIQKGPTTQSLKVAPMTLAEDGKSVMIDLTEMPKLR